MMPSSRSTCARAAISGTTPPNAACSSVCDRTISDRIRPDPSLWRSTTAAAVSSQVVSMPSTRIGLSLPNVNPCGIVQAAFAYPGIIARPRSAIVSWADAVRGESLPGQGCEAKYKTMAVLVTRPHPDNEATTERLRARGFKVLLAPMLRFEPVAFRLDTDSDYGGVVFPSAHLLWGVRPQLSPGRAVWVSPFFLRGGPPPPPPG